MSRKADKPEEIEQPMECDHGAGYLITEGVLCCVGCGRPSMSKVWRDNVFGFETPEAQMPHEEVEGDPVPYLDRLMVGV